MEFSLSVNDPMGLHSRPAGKIVMLARTLEFEISLGISSENMASGLSPLSLMALKAKPGQELLFNADTDDQVLASQIASEIQSILDGE